MATIVTRFGLGDTIYVGRFPEDSPLEVQVMEKTVREIRITASGVVYHLDAEEPFDVCIVHEDDACVNVEDVRAKLKAKWKTIDGKIDDLKVKAKQHG